MNSNINIMSDKEITSDSLTTQKHLTGMYNMSANECANENLRADMLNILQQEHDIQFDIYREMSKRGWYPTEQAPQDKITTVKNQVSQG